MAFGLSPTAHLGGQVHDLDIDGKFPSWWNTGPVDVPVSLREYGRRSAPGRTGRRHDYSALKHALALEQQHNERERERAAERLVTVDLATTTIDPSTWSVLLGYLDQALAGRQAAGTFDTTIRSPHAVIRLRSADHDTELRAPMGTVRLSCCELTIDAADAATSVATTFVGDPS